MLGWRWEYKIRSPRDTGITETASDWVQDTGTSIRHAYMKIYANAMR